MVGWQSAALTSFSPYSQHCLWCSLASPRHLDDALRIRPPLVRSPDLVQLRLGMFVDGSHIVGESD